MKRNQKCEKITYWLNFPQKGSQSKYYKETILVASVKNKIEPTTLNHMMDNALMCNKKLLVLIKSDVDTKSNPYYFIAMETIWIIII